MPPIDAPRSRKGLDPALRPIDREAINAKIADHRLWLESDGTAGKQAVFFCCDLNGADFAQAALRMASVEWADLQAADFREADLRGASFYRADVRGARFDHARADAIMMWGALSQDACFAKASLVGAFFRYAQLERSAFDRANLTNADFADAVFDGASFRRATISGVNLWCLSMPPALVEGARANKGTSLNVPDRFRLQSADHPDRWVEFKEGKVKEIDKITGMEV